MSFGAIAGTVVAGVATSAISSRLSRGSQSRGSQSPQGAIENFRPAGFSAPGLTVAPRGNHIQISRDPLISGVLERLSQASSNNINQLTTQGKLLRHGFSELNNANTGLLSERVKRIRDASQASISNLRDNLARRGLSGASFASDALARVENEFLRQEDLARAENAEIRARNILAEIDAQNQIINQQFNTRVGKITAFIDQANFETSVGANIVGGVTTALQNSATTLASLRAQEAAGRGAFFQPAIEAIGSAVGRGVQNLFQPSITNSSNLIPNSSRG